VDRGVPRAHITLFPRRFRRGLIEAGMAWGRITPTDIDFRGDSAAASLKLMFVLRGVRPNNYFRGDSAAASLKRSGNLPRRDAGASFPRRFRRGLIEAKWPSSTACRPRRYFRGDSAAASLKLHSGAGQVIDVGEFPRRFRRGLIEAGTPGT